jgi:hypothetical protein
MSHLQRLAEGLKTLVETPYEATPASPHAEVTSDGDVLRVEFGPPPEAFPDDATLGRLLRAGWSWNPSEETWEFLLN